MANIIKGDGKWSNIASGSMHPECVLSIDGVALAERQADSFRVQRPRRFHA